MGASIQVIDSVYGRPAVGLTVRIARISRGGWADEEDEQTNERGHVPRLSGSLVDGEIYRLEFDLDRYFSGLGMQPFYSAVSVRVRAADAHQQHHVTLFITPYSCAAYQANW